MKICKYIPAVLALGFALSSCKSLNEIPEFEQKDSFVAFSAGSYMFDENAGTVEIQVNMSCVRPVKTTVAYEVVVDADATDTAVQGEHFTLADPYAILNFDGTTRSQTIKINIIDKPNQMTGDMSFRLELKHATGMIKLGDASSCKVTIVDLDHPLAKILGSYNVSGTSFFDGKHDSWTMTLSKVAGDYGSVMITGFSPVFKSEVDAFVATVAGTDGNRIISVALGQTIKSQKASDKYTMSLWALTEDSKVSSSGILQFTEGPAGTFTTEEGWAICYESPEGIGAVSAYSPGTTVWVKK